MQLCLEQMTLASAWSDEKPAADQLLSLIGVSMARAWVHALEPGRRRTWSLALEHRINEIQHDSGRPLPLDERVMEAWAEIRGVKLEQQSLDDAGKPVDDHGKPIFEGIGRTSGSRSRPRSPIATPSSIRGHCFTTSSAT